MKAATANSAPCSAPAALLPHALFNRPLPLSAGHCPCAATRLDPGVVDGTDPNESRYNGSGHVMEAVAHPAASWTVSTGCVGLLTALSLPSLFLPPLVLLADWTASGPGGPLLPTAPRTTCFAMRGSTRRLAAACHGPCSLARCVRPVSACVSCAVSLMPPAALCPAPGARPPQRTPFPCTPTRTRCKRLFAAPGLRMALRGAAAPSLSHLHAHDLACRAPSLARTFIPPVVRRSLPAIHTAAALCRVRHVSCRRNRDMLAALALVCTRCLLPSCARFM